MVIHLRDANYKPKSRISFSLDKSKLIGSGTFGKIHETLVDGKKMALKEFTYANDMFHGTTIREIKALKQIQSPFVLEIHEILVVKYKIYLLVDFYEYDLYRILDHENFSLTEIKKIFWSILKGVDDIHFSGYLHRDLKTSNILITELKKENEAKSGVHPINQWAPESQSSNHREFSIKICDFGMARLKAKEMTPGVVTLWYRAPEILLGAMKYDGAADIWSLGCILLELFNKHPVFKGSNEIEELDCISEICGKIDGESFPNVEMLPYYSRFTLKGANRNLIERFKEFDKLGIELADQMLNLDPKKRPTTQECLNHEFFRSLIYE